ncbi:MAG: polymer-forming cytoskeletal protein [Sorangiineae bacterium]|nr:polymer-forming cytoskeletal protein [Polyangiaceae bacterium]MEB2325119.1 polymer-forming cytoskeletal protein [Sorangiineae bacterium]
MATQARDTAVLGPTTRVTGHVGGEGALRIEGSVRGDVSVTGPAEIARGGAVEGDVHAESLEIAGTLTGDVIATGPVAVRAGATVEGALKGSRVSIEPGATVAVRLDTEFELELGPARRRR